MNVNFECLEKIPEIYNLLLLLQNEVKNKVEKNRRRRRPRTKSWHYELQDAPLQGKDCSLQPVGSRRRRESDHRRSKFRRNMKKKP